MEESLEFQVNTLTNEHSELLKILDKQDSLCSEKDSKMEDDGSIESDDDDKSNQNNDTHKDEDTNESEVPKDTDDNVDSVYLRRTPPQKLQAVTANNEENSCGIKCLYYTLQCCDCVIM